MATIEKYAYPLLVEVNHLFVKKLLNELNIIENFEESKY